MDAPSSCMFAQGSIAERNAQQPEGEADPEDVLHVQSPARGARAAERGTGPVFTVH